MNHSELSPSPVDLSIVIVNWNSKDYLRRCLETVETNVKALRSEVIVVDSGSFDGCGEMLSAEFPSVHFIQSQENVGFASANNIGARLARGSVLLFLNPDTEVRDDAVQRLYETVVSAPSSGIVGPKLLNTDGSLQASCVQLMPTIVNQLVDIEVLHKLFPRHSLWTSAARFEGVPGPVRIEALSGACMTVRKDLFDRVGGFSSDYFMYAEDLDLCWKVAGTGAQNLYLPEALVVHHGGGSTQHGRSHFSEVMVPESVSRLLRKTHGNLYSLGYRCSLSFAALLRLMLIALSFPAGALVKKTNWWAVMFRKWLAILRWGLGLERWVKKYGHSV